MLYSIECSGVRTRPTWVNKVKNLLYLANLCDVWERQEVSCIDSFVRLFVENFKRYLFTKWQSEVCSMDKLVTYREFKTSLEPDKYLFIVKVPIHLKMLARFRCSTHYLRIETDRKHNIERWQRLCQLCQSNEAENEYHFLLICPFYDHYRTKYIPICNVILVKP